MIEIGSYILDWTASIFGHLDEAPWQVTTRATGVVHEALNGLDGGYRISGGIAIHESAIVEPGAIVKGPAIIGPDCFVAATTYLRDGVFLDRDCTIGPACELKSTFMFRGSKAAHLSFVGDSLVGARTNIEAGAIVANYRNEMDDKRIRIRADGKTIDTGVDKFGALIGDGCRIGANAVIAPGALIAPGFQLARLGLIDQHPEFAMDRAPSR